MADEPVPDFLQFWNSFDHACRFMILRTKTSVTPQEAQIFATVIDTHLNQRMVTAVLKQKYGLLCHFLSFLIMLFSDNYLKSIRNY